MLPVVQVPLFFIPERALFLHVIKGTITVGNDKFSVFWPKWIYENLGRACVCSTQCSSILLCSSSSVKTSLNSSISLTPLSATSFTTLRSLISILISLYSSKSHHLSREYVRKRMSCKERFSRWKMMTDRSLTRSETQVSKDKLGN